MQKINLTVVLNAIASLARAEEINASEAVSLAAAAALCCNGHRLQDGVVDCYEFYAMAEECGVDHVSGAAWYSAQYNARRDGALV